MKVNWENEKETIKKLINEGVSYECIGRRYDVSGAAVKKAAIKLGIELERRRKINPNEHFNKKEKQAYLTKDNFEEMVIKYVPLSSSMSNLCRVLGLKCGNFYYDKLWRIIVKYNISTEHFTQQRKNVSTDKNGKFIPMTDSEYFVDGRARNGPNTLKRLIKNKYKENKCECCGITEWNGKKISLQIHHINGKHEDNRLCNLQLLCPNCHAQTDTYSNKRRRRINCINENELISIDKINKPVEATPQKAKKFCHLCGNEITTDGKKYCSPKCAQLASRKFNASSEQLIADFKEFKTYRSVARKYGVSDNAVKKRCKKLEIYGEIEQYITHR